MVSSKIISYDNLDSYFYGFSIWDENNVCLSADETEEWFDLLGMKHVPIISYLYSVGNEWDYTIQQMAEKAVLEGSEGIVIRTREAFHYYDFSNNVAKYVRPNHVTTAKHWSHSKIIPNKLRSF